MNKYSFYAPYKKDNPFKNTGSSAIVTADPPFNIVVVNAQKSIRSFSSYISVYNPYIQIKTGDTAEFMVDYKAVILVVSNPNDVMNELSISLIAVMLGSIIPSNTFTVSSKTAFITSLRILLMNERTGKLFN